MSKRTLGVATVVATLAASVWAQTYVAAPPPAPVGPPAVLDVGLSAGDATGRYCTPGLVCREDLTDDLNCLRVLISDIDDPTFAAFRMMVFDLGMPQRGVRLYPALDHWDGSPDAFWQGCCGYSADFVTQDVMEYSIWGTNNPTASMASWTLLSDPIGFDNSMATVTALGHPIFSFAGVAGAPQTIYTVGEPGCNGGIGNAYARDYNFCEAYRYIGVRSSTLTYAAGDGDPEIDAVFGFDPAEGCAGGADECVACDTIYACDTGTGLWAIDPITAVSTFIGNMPANMFDIGITSDGRLFGSTGGGVLYQISACDANGVVLGSSFGNGMAGDLTTSDLYTQGPPLQVQDTDPVGPPAPVGGAFGAGGPPAWCGASSGDLAMNPNDGLFYSTLGCPSCAGADMLVIIDPATGDVISEVGCLVDAGGVGYAGTFGVAFNSMCNFWAGQGSSNPRLLRVNPNTAEVTVVPISGGFNSANGLASLPCAPQPCELMCPADIVVQSDPWSDECTADVTFQLQASGGCIMGTVTCDPPSGSAFPLGVTQVFCTAEGNCLSDACDFTVTVEDATPPSITCPANVVLPCGADTTPEETGEPEVDDVCGGVDVTHSDVVTPGCGNTVSILRTWTATDNVGNVAQCVQSIDTQDLVPPVVECNAMDIEPYHAAVAGSGSGSGGSGGSGSGSGGGAGGAPLVFTPTATDDCGAASVTILSVTCSAPVLGSGGSGSGSGHGHPGMGHAGSGGSGSGGGAAPACDAVIDGNSVLIYNSGPAGTVIEWTVEAVDECGNVTVEVCVVNVVAPVAGSGSGSGAGSGK